MKFRDLVGTAIAMGVVACGSAALADQDYAADERAGIEAFEQGDLIRAMGLLERAAEAGSPLAQTRLAWILDGANDDKRAVALFRDAAKQGFAPGMHGLAEMYAKGEGIEQSFEQAIAWLEKAADAGDEKSVRRLLEVYENGGLGLEPDPAEAERYREMLERTVPSESDGAAQ